MNEHENFVIKYFYKIKLFIDFLLNRLLVLTGFLALLPLFFIPYLFIYLGLAQLSNSNYLNLPLLFNYMKSVAFTAFIICIVRLLLDAVFILPYHFVVKIKNHSLSTHEYHTILLNWKEYDKLSVQIHFLRISKVLRLLSITVSCLLALATLIPIILKLIEGIQSTPSITFTFSTLISIVLGIVLYEIFPVTYGLLIYYIVNSNYNKIMRNCLTQPSPHNSLMGVNIDRLSGVDFEYYCAVLLSQIGFEQVNFTPASHDQGVDLTAFKNKYKYAIQCKRYKQTVGNKAIQEVVAGMQIYNCHKAIVMTNNYFTPAAISLAQANHVELVDREKLLKMLQSAAFTTEYPSN